MRRTLRFFVPLLFAGSVLGFLLAPANAQEWESSEQWGEWQDGDYTLYNNIWGEGAGDQTIWANSASDWGVIADHPNTGGIKSYPNASRSVDANVSEVDSLTSEFDISVPDDGAYVAAYDIWADDHEYEIMLWMSQYGPVGPIGEQVDTVELGGHTWDVHTGSNGSNEVFSFIRQENTTSGEVDILEIMEWIDEQGWYDDATIGDVQFGYEITSASGGLEFTTNDYSVDVE